MKNAFKLGVLALAILEVSALAAEVSFLVVSVVLVEVVAEESVLVESEPEVELLPLQATIEEIAKANTPNLNAFFIL